MTDREHSSASAEHYSPAWVVEAARAVMGAIDLDPCSCEQAQATVKATAYYTVADFGLTREWRGRVYVNPPGDPMGRLVQAFWRKLADEIRAGRVEQMVWLAFNISQLRTLQREGRYLLEQCWVTVPGKRIAFTGSSPTRDNALLYWGCHGETWALDLDHCVECVTWRPIIARDRERV